MRKLNYQQLKAQGLCVRCAKPNPDTSKAMCPECAKKNSEQRKENRVYWKRIGRCTKCGKNPPEPNRLMCYECLGAESDRYLLKEKKAEDKEKEKIHKREKAAQNRENGLCYRCGKQKVIGGGLCKKCKAYQKRYRDKNRCDIERSDRVSYGLCYICGSNELMDGKRICPKCYETRLKTLPSMWENANNEYFRQLETARRMAIASHYKKPREA